jgi:hypothetical protein
VVYPQYVSERARALLFPAKSLLNTPKFSVPADFTTGV